MKVTFRTTSWADGGGKKKIIEIRVNGKKGKAATKTVTKPFPNDVFGGLQSPADRVPRAVAFLKKQLNPYLKKQIQSNSVTNLITGLWGSSSTPFPFKVTIPLPTNDYFYNLLRYCWGYISFGRLGWSWVTGRVVRFGYYALFLLLCLQFEVK